MQQNYKYKKNIKIKSINILVIIQHVDNKAFIKLFLEAGTWSDTIMCGCEQFEVVEVDNGDNFSHLGRFYLKRFA